ncbi:hypothetical protein MVEN_02520400 [Mycena venus]|uniref:Uncharacterized protein n=1 Tax=Mycena venus TaxID=2733690 RepID=A0A8H6WUL8_9AGAR|nr:hypothetical protein MVEN_02520400 [Mycena venus]
MIIDEKSMLQPPPPYVSANGNGGPPPFPHCRPAMTLSTLPPHLLLQIVHMTFPQTPAFDEGKVERQRKTLYWLAVSLRLVNRALYIACMHVLRSTYLPAYDSLIRSPYSSDPFPLPTGPQSAFVPVNPANLRLGTIQRETATLDLFIALKVREDVWADDSELHLERDESFKDLFDLAQPRSRLEDLVRVYGLREGVVGIDSLAPPSGHSSGNASPSPTSGVFRNPPAVPDYATLRECQGEAAGAVAQTGADPVFVAYGFVLAEKGWAANGCSGKEQAHDCRDGENPGRAVGGRCETTCKAVGSLVGSELDPVVPHFMYIHFFFFFDNICILMRHVLRIHGLLMALGWIKAINNRKFKYGNRFFWFLRRTEL